jgi:hypothetical protein
MIASIFIYFVLPLLCLLAQKRSVNWSKGVRLAEIVVAVSLFSLISGIRYDVGTDWHSYNDWSIGIAKGMVDKEDYQILFVRLGSIFSGKLFGTGIFFAAIGAAQMLTLSVFAYRRSFSSLLLLAIILSSGISLFWFNGLRQVIAVNFGFLYFISLKERKIWPSLLFFLAALGFHKSALFLLPLSAILFIEKPLYGILAKRGILIYVICLFLGTTGNVDDVLSDISTNFLKYTSLGDARLEVGIEDLIELKQRDIAFGFRRVLNALTVLYTFYFLRKIDKINLDRWWVVLFWIGEIYKVLIEESISDFMRIYYFFLPFKIFVIMEMFRSMKYLDKRSKSIPHLMFLIVTILTSLFSAYFDYSNINASKHVYFQLR